MEADLLEHYGVRLGDLLTGRLSWRRLGVLLRQLPEQARTRVAVTDLDVLEDAPWTLTNLLLATIVDTLNLANWQRGGKGKRPRPIPRPGVKPAGRRYGRTKRPQAWVLAELAKRAPKPEQEVTG